MARLSSMLKDNTLTPPTPVVSKITDRVWSEQQNAIFDWFSGYRCKENCQICNQSQQHLIVRARAGTGKTTTIVEGVKRAPEEFILVTSFGKRIVKELRDRVGGGDVQTLHGVGNTYIRRAWRGLSVVGNGWGRGEWLTEQVVGKNAPKQIRRLITNLHTKGREIIPLTYSVETLTDLALRFDLVPEDWDEWTLNGVATAAHCAMSFAAQNEPDKKIGIDFADMIYLPLVHNLAAKDYELVVVDEAQDMTLAQLELAIRSCSGRICIVGDDKQAIYGFRGADTNALDRLKRQLHAIELPLATTYRCGRAIVEVAQRLVPDIRAGVTNGAGVVSWCDAEQLPLVAKPGDFILSRLNAPLVSICLRLLRSAIPAFMAGRDIGSHIDTIIRRFRLSATTPIETLLEQLMKWENREIGKVIANGRQDLIGPIRDKADTIRAFAEDCNTVGNMLQHCAKVLVSEEDLPAGNYVLCSSVHKAKGLEANTVYVLIESFYRWGPSQEEDNCYYVAITRAKESLVWVEGVPSLQRRQSG